jgi:GNAT superfamily N-acetyltransferase
VVEGSLELATPAEIDRLVQEHWGVPVVCIDRLYVPAELEGLVWRDGTGDIRGLVTWAAKGEWAEIVTIDAFVQGAHIGGRLLDAAEAELRRRGVRTVVVVTTNDNLPALSLYVRRRYRLVRLDLDGMERVRALKPGVPETGHEGLPLRDMWELRKEFHASKETGLRS